MKKSIKLSLVTLLSSFTLAAAFVSPVLAEDNSEKESSLVEEAATDKEKTDKSEAQTVLDAALVAFRDRYPDAQIESLSVEIEKDGAIKVDIDAFDETDEIELTFLAKDNKFAKEERETLDANDTHTAIDIEKVLSLDEITELANKESGRDDIESWSLDTESENDNKPVWNVEYKETAKDKDDDEELHLDAETGDVLTIKAVPAN